LPATVPKRERLASVQLELKAMDVSPCLAERGGELVDAAR